MSDQTTQSAVLFLVFNRPDTTATVMEAIRRARPPRLYVAADGPRDRPGEAQRCEEARLIATAVDWPCEVQTLFRDHNLGCGRAVSGGINWFFEHEEEGIILEDDCLPSSDFFGFCTELLERYRTDARVMAVCGSSYADPGPRYGASYYFSYYADIWGWATWRRAWQFYDRDLSRWPEFKERGGLEVISTGRAWHQAYWTSLFDATREGRIDTWDYPWIFTVIERGGLACYPTQNLISNLGYRADATHTVVDDRAGRPPPIIAGLPLEALPFALHHPPVVARLTAVEGQIEDLRLGLTRPPPKLIRRAKTLGRRLIRTVQSRLANNPDRFLKNCISLVHVGANTGQERALYDLYGLAVTWIEPIPAVYQELVRNISPYPRQVAVQALLADRPGQTLTLNVANNSGASSSIFHLALHRDIWPEVYYVDCVQMQTETLDGLLERGVVRLPIDAVVLDTQGSELMVLQGSEEVLRQLKYAKVEAADFQAYEGGATVATIENFLKKHHFRLLRKTTFAEHPAGGRYYDLLFKRAA